MRYVFLSICLSERGERCGGGSGVAQTRSLTVSCGRPFPQPTQFPGCCSRGRVQGTSTKSVSRKWRHPGCRAQDVLNFIIASFWHTEGMPSLYETDYHQWAVDTAKAIREDRLHHVDLAAVAEEIEDLGKSERRALSSAISQLYVHLLKQRHQTGLSGSSWEISVKKQRRQITKLVKESPSFKPFLRNAEFIQDAYEDAVLEAAEQTGLPEETFPVDCPFTFEDFGFPQTFAKPL
jgi:hypothetical protein